MEGESFFHNLSQFLLCYFVLVVTFSHRKNCKKMKKYIFVGGGRGLGGSDLNTFFFIICYSVIVTFVNLITYFKVEKVPSDPLAIVWGFLGAFRFLYLLHWCLLFFSFFLLSMIRG